MNQGASLEFVNSTQQRFGTIDYSQWQGVRSTFYSRVKYPEAGSNQLTFFADVQGQAGVTKFITNMPKANSFGQTFFLIKSIHCDLWVADAKLQPTDLLDANNIASDYLNGLLHAGVLDFSIGSRPYLQVPKPLLYLPPLSSTPDVIGAGNTTITIAANNQSVVQTDAPLVTQQSGRDKMFVLEPPQLIEPEQNFSVTISYPSGLVPIIATGVTDDTSNPLYIGIHLDGVLLRPLQ